MYTKVSHWSHDLAVREAKFVSDSPALSYIKTYISDGYNLKSFNTLAYLH